MIAPLPLPPLLKSMLKRCFQHYGLFKMLVSRHLAETEAGAKMVRNFLTEF